MEDQQTREAQRRGARAADLLNDPLLQECFSRIEASQMDNWRNTDLADARVREEIFHLVRAMDLLRKELQIVVEHGQLASARLERQSRGKDVNG